MLSKRFKTSTFAIDKWIAHIQGRPYNYKVLLETMHQSTLVVIEKYFQRNNSDASASILFCNQGEIDILVVVSGAGAGVFGWSAGASKKLMEELTFILTKYGATQIEQDK